MMSVLNRINKKRLKIGYIMQADAPDMSIVSATQLHVKAIVQGFNKIGHHVRLVMIQKGRAQWTEDIHNWYPCELGFSETIPFHLFESTVRGVQSRFRLPFWRFFDSYRFSDACVSALSDYDILYERDSTISYGGLITAHRLGIPIVLEVNGDLVEEWNHLGLRMSKAQWALVHFITRQNYKRATHIVTVGETIKRRLIQRWNLDASNVSVVTNGFERDLYLDLHAQLDCTDRFSIGSGPVIMFIGGFKPWHGVDLILRGFNHVKSLVPNARMVFVGDGPLRLDLQQQADILGLKENVVFTGRVDHRDIPMLLNLADIAVIYHIGSAAEIVETPLKLFEYMAAGKAIVAPAVPNMERVLTDRVNALLVPPDTPRALAQAIIQLINDSQLRCALGENAKKEAFEKHSWDRAVRELESILFRVLSKYGRGNISENEE
jgi:glycosyltransferase involved in cell wall biosynthesis